MYNNYKFHKSGNKVIAISSFAGKTVKGVAKCDPADNYSAEFGEKLASARCNKKVAFKRLKSANAKLLNAEKALKEAQKQLELMINYYGDSMKKFTEANEDLNKLLESADV